LESPFNIYATAEASDFKFGVQLGFAKGHHNITPRGKVGVVIYRKTANINVKNRVYILVL